MPYEVWDVVSIPAFPNQEDTKQTTGRPAIIIEDLEDEVCVCPVTKQVHQASNYSYTIFVSASSAEARQMGLTFDSLIVLDRTPTLRKIRLLRQVGKCPSSIIEKIEDMIEKMKKDGKY